METYSMAKAEFYSIEGLNLYRTTSAINSDYSNVTSTLNYSTDCLSSLVSTGNYSGGCC